LLAGGAVLFVVMFLFRLLYGYTSPEARGQEQDVTAAADNYFENVQGLRKNYASEKLYESKMAPPAPVAMAAPLPTTDQKYEKTATIRTVTHSWVRDERQVKRTIETFHAVIQYEQNMGLSGNRQLQLMIGVAPTLFDSFYTELKAIGKARSIEITKTDKTNDYLKLNAQKESLQKTLANLLELKQKGGQIADYISLNDKILEIEERIQGLGVELGNFDEVNEFCTVKFSLYEARPRKIISTMHRILRALEWTATWYAIIMLGLAGLGVIVYTLLAAADKLTNQTKDNHK
jgi:hypothetical protein